MCPFECSKRDATSSTPSKTLPGNLSIRSGKCADIQKFSKQPKSNNPNKINHLPKFFPKFRP